MGVFEDSAFIGLFDTDVLKQIGTEIPEGKVYGYARAPFYAYNTPAMEAFIKAHKALANGQYPSDWAILVYDSILTLKTAAEKAGSTNGDAVAKALDDLSVDSLRGKVTIRACDHMADAGEYVGTLAKDDKYPFGILTKLTYYPAKDLWNTCDEIAQMRAAAAATAAPTATAAK